MRVTKLLIKENEVLTALEDLSSMSEQTTDDITLTKDYVKDVYSLFKTNSPYKSGSFRDGGLIYQDAINLYSQYAVSSIQKTYEFYMRVRYSLETFAYSRLYNRLVKLDPLQATETFLEIFKKKDEQEEQKQNAEDSTGQGAIAGVGQDQGGASANANNLPIDLESFVEKAEEIDKWLASGLLEDELLLSAAGIEKGDYKLGQISQLIETIGERLGGEALSIFEVARNHELLTPYRVGEEVERSLTPDNDMTIDTNESLYDIRSLLPIEHAYGDDYAMRKLINREAMIIQPMTRNKKRQIMYILLDISGSMDGIPGIYASGVAIALVKQCISEGSTYYLSRFAYDADKPTIIKTTTDAAGVINELAHEGYDGGGTDIEGAILSAVEEITKNDDYDKAEIMIITDGEDNVAMSKEKLRGVLLHSTLIDGHNKGLEALSDSYTQINSSNIGGILSKMSKTVYQKRLN